MSNGPTSTAAPPAPVLDYLLPDTNGPISFQGQSFRVAHPGVDSLRFGAWDNAFKTPNTLRNGAAEADNFIGSDTRRFHLRVTDAASRGKGSVTVKWATFWTQNSSQPMDQPGNSALTLLENTATPGEFISRGLMLVRFVVDQAVAAHTGLPGGAAVKRGAANFRIRRGGIFNFVGATYKSLAPVFMPVFQAVHRRTLQLHVFVFRNVSGNPVVDPAGAYAQTMFWSQIWFANDVYESQGIFFATLPYTVNPALNLNPIVQKDDPAQPRFEVTVVNAPPMVNVSGFDPLEDTIRVNNAFPPGASRIRVFFIDSFTSGFGVDGFSLSKSHVARQPAFSDNTVGCVFFNPAGTNHGVGHEIGHILMDKADRLGAATPPGSRGNHFISPSDPFTQNQNLMTPVDLLLADFLGNLRLWNKADADNFNQLDELLNNRQGFLI
jgi:hypothetical protein